MYYLDNLLCDVSVPVGVPRCQFFKSNVIEDISKADRDLSNRGFVTYGKLPVSNFILFLFRHLLFISAIQC